MQFNITTDYAIRSVVYLASHPGVCNCPDISESMVIPISYLRKILHKLKEAGLVRNFLGSNGGFALAKPAEEITLLEIIRIMEDTVFINRCLEYDHYCSREAVAACPINRVYCKLQAQLEETLNVSVAALLQAE